MNHGDSFHFHGKQFRGKAWSRGNAKREIEPETLIENTVLWQPSGLVKEISTKRKECKESCSLMELQDRWAIRHFLLNRYSLKKRKRSMYNTVRNFTEVLEGKHGFKSTRNFSNDFLIVHFVSSLNAFRGCISLDTKCFIPVKKILNYSRRE